MGLGVGVGVCVIDHTEVKDGRTDGTFTAEFVNPHNFLIKHRQIIHTINVTLHLRRRLRY